MSCNTNLCKRCYNAIFILSSTKDKDNESLSARDLLSTEDSHGYNLKNRRNDNNNKDFFDKDEVIRKLEAKVKGLEKIVRDQKKEIDGLNLKLEQVDEEKIAKFNIQMINVFQNFKKEYVFKEKK